MAVEIFQFTQEAPAENGVSACYLEAGSGFFMTDHAADPAKLVLITCEETGFGDVFTTTVGDEDITDPAYQLSEAAFTQARTDPNRRAHLDKGERQSYTYVNDEGQSKIMVVRNIGDLPVRGVEIKAISARDLGAVATRSFNYQSLTYKVALN